MPARFTLLETQLRYLMCIVLQNDLNKLSSLKISVHRATQFE